MVRFLLKRFTALPARFFVSSNAQRAQAYSDASTASPASITRIPGPGNTRSTEARGYERETDDRDRDTFTATAYPRDERAEAHVAIRSTTTVDHSSNPSRPFGDNGW